jgi:hypothetical protein
MAQLLAITCKSCSGEIGLDEYTELGAKQVEWRNPVKIKCPNSACGKEHEYSGGDFHLSEGEAPL